MALEAVKPLAVASRRESASRSRFALVTARSRSGHARFRRGAIWGAARACERAAAHPRGWCPPSSRRSHRRFQWQPGLAPLGLAAREHAHVLIAETHQLARRVSEFVQVALAQALLFDEEYVCLVRDKNPKVASRLTLKQCLSLSHVLVSERAAGGGSVDRALAKLGHTRRIGLYASHFLMVPEIVAQTDMIAALSRRIAEPFARRLPLRIFPPPIALPRGRVGQVWHARTDADPAQAWFRSLVARVSARV